MDKSTRKSSKKKLLISIIIGVTIISITTLILFLFFSTNLKYGDPPVYNCDDEWYIERLKKPTCLARYNDGEWYAMRKSKGANCDNHKYFPEMGQMLRKAISNPNNKKDDYIFQNAWYVNNMIKDYRKWNGKVLFLKDDNIHNISRNNPVMWKRLLDIIHEHPVVFVGPKHLSDCGQLSPIVHIVIPDVNCFLKIDAVINELRNLFKQYNRVNVVMCASMATNCIVDQLYPEVSGKHSIIDFGSALDVFTNVGVSRLSSKKRSGFKSYMSTYPSVHGRHWRKLYKSV